MLPRTPPHLLVALIVALTLAGCSGPPQVLRGPKPRKGEATRTETKMTLKNGKVVMRAGPERAEGTCSLTASSVEEDEILEVEEGRVTKLQTTVVSDESTETIDIDGEKDTHTDRSPLVGETVLRERKGGEWVNTLVGKEATQKQRKELESLPPLESNDDLIPEGPVSPGFSWKLDAARLRKLIGTRCTDLTGEATMTFVKTASHDGETCLLLGIDMKVKGKMLDDVGNDVSVEMAAKGTTYQSLKSGYDLKMSLTGTIKTSATVESQGQRVRIEMSGPIAIESSTKPK